VGERFERRGGGGGGGGADVPVYWTKKPNRAASKEGRRHAKGVQMGGGIIRV